MGCCSSCSCNGSRSGSDGLLKFSGFVGTAEGGGSFVSYLADAGIVLDEVETSAMNYPMALQRTLKGLSVNVGITLSSGQSILVEVLRNGSSIPGFNVTYGVGDTGVKTNESAGPITYAAGDTFALRVTTAGFNGSDFAMFATVGVV